MAKRISNTSRSLSADKIQQPALVQQLRIYKLYVNKNVHIFKQRNLLDVI